MTPRYLLAVVFTLSLIGGVAAKEKQQTEKARPARTWKDIVDHAWKTGEDWPIKAPTSRNLGFNTDEVKAKAVSIDDDKSKDGIEHGFRVVYEPDATGKPIQKCLVISTNKVTETAAGKKVDGITARMTLDGKVVQGRHGTGLVGEVVQTVLKSDSSELKAFVEKESRFYLKEVDLKSLKP